MILASLIKMYAASEDEEKNGLVKHSTYSRKRGSITFYISRLRKKIEKDPEHPKSIRIVRGNCISVSSISHVP